MKLIKMAFCLGMFLCAFMHGPAIYSGDLGRTSLETESDAETQNEKINWLDLKEHVSTQRPKTVEIVRGVTISTKPKMSHIIVNLFLLPLGRKAQAMARDSLGRLETFRMKGKQRVYRQVPEKKDARELFKTNEIDEFEKLIEYGQEPHPLPCTLL